MCSSSSEYSVFRIALISERNVLRTHSVTLDGILLHHGRPVKDHSVQLVHTTVSVGVTAISGG